MAWRSACHLLLINYLLLTAYRQVAWLSAYRFARRPPTFVGLDDVVFKKPVEVAADRREIAADRREIGGK